MRVPGIGAPREVVLTALAAMEQAGFVVEAVAPVIETAPVGPSLRRYANTAAIVATAKDPPEVLASFQRIETRFGRRRRGQRWQARPLDLDIALWDGGVWVDRALTIPHPAYRKRAFVLGPAAAIAPRWRDPERGMTLRHLHARLTRPRPLPR